MIQAAVIVMTVMGCGDQMMSCDMIPDTQTKWESQTQCTAAIPATLRAIKTTSHPTITATCEAEATSEHTHQPVINIAPPPQIAVVKEETIPAIAVLEDDLSFSKLQAKAATYKPALLTKTGAFFNRTIDTTKAQLAKLKAPFTKQETTY